MIVSYPRYRDGPPEGREIVKIEKYEGGERFIHPRRGQSLAEHGYYYGNAYEMARGYWRAYPHGGWRWQRDPQSWFSVDYRDWPYVVWFSDGTFGAIERGALTEALGVLGATNARTP